MKQTATFYIVTEETFRQLEKSDDTRKIDIPSISKSRSVFQSTFGGLEFLLTKGQDAITAELSSEIFFPNQLLGGQDSDSLIEDEQLESFINSNFIPYLDPETISKINGFLTTIEESNLQEKYDTKEFNNYAIYPHLSNNDYSSDESVYEQHLWKDFSILKNIIKQTDEDKDYILVLIT